MDDPRVVAQWVAKQTSRISLACASQIDVQVHECKRRKNGQCGCNLYGFVAHACKTCEPRCVALLQEAKRDFLQLKKEGNDPAASSLPVSVGSSSAVAELVEAVADLKEEHVAVKPVERNEGNDPAASSLPVSVGSSSAVAEPVQALAVPPPGVRACGQIYRGAYPSICLPSGKTITPCEEVWVQPRPDDSDKQGDDGWQG